MTTVLLADRSFSITAADGRNHVDLDRDRRPTYSIAQVAEVVDRLSAMKRGGVPGDR
jgi:hypothetical protein